MLHQAYYVGHPVPITGRYLDPLSSGAIPKNLRDVPGGISRPVRIGQGDNWWAQPDFWQNMAAAAAQTAQVFNVIGGGQPATTYPVTTQAYGVPPPSGYPYPTLLPAAGVPTWVWVAGAAGLGLVLLLMLMPSGRRR